MDKKLIKELQEIKILDKLQENRQTITNSGGYPIGYFDDNDTEICLYDLGNHYIGKYDKQNDQTSDAGNHFISNGNSLGMLLR